MYDFEVHVAIPTTDDDKSPSLHVKFMDAAGHTVDQPSGGCARRLTPSTHIAMRRRLSTSVGWRDCCFRLWISIKKLLKSSLVVSS